MTHSSQYLDFLFHLWRGAPYGCFWTPDGEERTNDQGEHYRVSQTLWTPSSKPTSLPAVWTSKCNVYFGVHPSAVRYSEHKKTSVEDIGAINTLYAEFDIKDYGTKDNILDHIKTLPFAPSMLIDSGGGIHAYWLLAETFVVHSTEDRERAAMLQRAWVHEVGGDGSVHDLARVLRVPGTLNHKYQPARRVDIIEFDLGTVYALEELETSVTERIEALRAQDAVVVHSTPSMASLNLDDHDLIQKAMNASANGVEFSRLWNGNAGQDHSAADQALINLLAFWTGKDAERMDRLFRQSGLMRDKWDRQDYRDSTIKRAIQGVRNVYDPTMGTNNKEAQQAAQAALNGTVKMSTAQANGNGHVHTMPVRNIQDILLNETTDDRGHSLCAYHLYGDQFVYTVSHGYLHYTGTHWETEGAEARLKQAVTDTLMQRRLVAARNNHEQLIKAAKPSATNVRNCIYMLSALIEISMNEFDNDPDLLNCQNGVVDLRTGQLIPHDPAQRFTYCVPVDYDPNADYVEWIEFLHDILSDVDMADYIQMAAGYSATGHTREECLFYVHGPSRSGKGTFAETILTILPRPLGVQADFGTFTAKREGDTQNFDLAPLKPARFIVASESSKYDTLNEAKIKTATGGDWIRCAFKHRDHFEYRPQFKIWLVSNHPVSGDVDDDAFWGRLRVIVFPNSYLGREDKRLKQRMKTPEMLRGVLAWLVEGSKRWYAQEHGLPIPQKVKEITQKHRNALDYIQQWLDACCNADPTSDTWSSNSVLYSSYKSWCDENGINAKGQRLFASALSSKGFNISVKRYLSNGKQARGIEGITIA